MSSPAKKESRWSRVVRRSSSLLVPSRPGTPSNKDSSTKDSDSQSIKSQRSQKLDTSSSTLTPPSAPAMHSHAAPSPIAESPQREAEALAAESAPVGPSPLAHQVTNASTEPATQPATPPEPVVEPEVLTSPASPEGYAPPPVVDHTIGNPGAFTDDVDLLPQPTVITDPYASRSQLDVSTSKEPETIKADTVDSAHQAQPTVPAQAELDSAAQTNPSKLPSKAPSVNEVPLDPAPQVQDRASSKPSSREPTSFFDKPFAESIRSVEAISHPVTFAAAVEANSAIASPEPEPAPAPQVVPPTPQVISPQIVPEEPPKTGFFPEIPLPLHQDLPPLTSHHESTSTNTREYTLPAYELHSGHDVWGGSSHQIEVPRAMPEPVVAVAVEGNGNAGSPDRNVRAVPEDPFADPIAPRIAISHSDKLHMPQPQPSPQRQHPILESESQAHGPESISASVSMPLPAFHDVIPSKSLNKRSSTPSFSFAREPIHIETDERQPLLSARDPVASYLQPSGSNIGNGSPSNISPSNGNAAAWVPNPTVNVIAVSRSMSATAPRLNELGWLEYHLPDGTYYYVHPTRRVATDINLRLDKMLVNVTNYLESANAGFGAGSSSAVGKEPAHGVEIWLRDVGNKKKGFLPVKSFVNHHARTVTVDRVIETGRGRKIVEEDQLDMEFRYWSFMEAHPAHTALPAKAKAEAMDVLTWAWTDRLLPSTRPIPSPFSQEECQELLALLRSFNDNQDDHGIQTRIVSRILLRVALWRQKYFRPDRPLPKDVSSNQLRLPTPHKPLRRALFDFVISCLCLGIPYLFLERSRIAGGRFDEETGALGLGNMRNAGPVLLIGACTCLVAAVVLSASVTFLSLPGLDGFARLAGLVAILFASFSMASTLVAVFRYKADMERAISFVGLEGLTNISRRAIIFSLPLVFLAYSIIGFVAGITVYSLRNGGKASNPSNPDDRFVDYTRWTVIGLLGALGGILVTTYVVARR